MVLAGSCHGQRPGSPWSFLPKPAAVDEQALRQATEAFYTAKTLEALYDACDRAERAGAHSARSHELKAMLSSLEARPEETVLHLLAALRDPADDATALHLRMLWDIPLTIPQRARVEELLRAVALGHRDPDVRAFASFCLSHLLFRQGDEAGSRQALSRIGWIVPLALLGPFDNDQGKGYDLPLPPESEIQSERRYQGSVVEISWRRDPPRDPASSILELDKLFSPSKWSLAYAAAAFQVTTPGPYELRILSSSPLKVWVNGALLFEARSVDGFAFDQYVVPVSLPRGTSRVLVKLANDDQARWAFLARLTAPSGAAVTGISALPFDSLATDGGPSPATPAVPELLAQRVAGLEEGSARRRFQQTLWAARGGALGEAVRLGDEYLGRFPGHLPMQYLLAATLWDRGERDRAGDILKEADRRAGDRLTLLRLQLSRFFSQDNLRKNAWDLLFKVKEEKPKLADLWKRMADLFDEEGWTDDRCDALAQANLLRPDSPAIRGELAACLQRQGFEEAARAIYERALEVYPADAGALEGLHGMAERTRDFARATKLAERLIRVKPHSPGAYLILAETLRRKGDCQGAEQALHKALLVNPDHALAWKMRGQIAFQEGDRALALAHWQEALARQPDDESLANHVDFLTAAHREPWEVDVPSEESVKTLLDRRGSVAILPGANVVHLLDHEVSRMKADGSTTNVITLVSQAINTEGRDSLIRQMMRSAGRVRVLQAYMIDPQGQRVVASSVRGREVRFKGLQVGSSTVLQYRCDEGAASFLGKHLARIWWFQAQDVQNQESTWVVWAPGGTRFHEKLPAGVIRQERVQGGEVRVAYTARDVPPLLLEPLMPSVFEMGMNMMLSSVPSWDVFMQWEDALLNEVLRDSPGLSALAGKLFVGTQTEAERVAKIHEFLLKEIRYERDYESEIAGVKPHAASVILKRGFGDCKDKAVLFIALGKLAGLDVHFALVRTRNAGPVVKAVPLQQFNHAIVYVPKQPGIAEGRFFDPTADGLDLDVIRLDDPGTTALVYDIQRRKWEWREIPFQPPTANAERMEARFTLQPDGSAEGQYELSLRGANAASLRRIGRNAEQLGKTLQFISGHVFPGSSVDSHRVIDLEDLSRPVRLEVRLHIPAFGRREGKEIRFRFPGGWDPAKIFELPKRKFPLVLGIPNSVQWVFKVIPPPRAKLGVLPSAKDIDAGCFRFTRAYVREGDALSFQQSLEIRCERISVADYAAYRSRLDGVIQAVQEDVVVKLP